MGKVTTFQGTDPSGTDMAEIVGRGSLDEIVRLGARRLLEEALLTEVEVFVEQHRDLRLKDGKQRVVRNGYMPPRSVLTGAGPLEVRRPRVRDNGDEDDEPIKFTSQLLPRYLRRSESLDELIPWLYLKGVSTGDFADALQAIVGPGAKGLSANVVVKLKDAWAEEFEAWGRRQFGDEEFVYVWADGVYFNVRLDSDERQCILVLIGATKAGRKVVLAVQDGYRESEQSWNELLVDLKARGMKPPKLAIGDGALGFWAAMRKAWPKTREQRCWVHKTANVLDKLPKNVQARAKKAIHQIYLAETKADALKAWDTFLEAFGVKYEKAVACLKKDRDELLAFYDFPAEHWKHIRSTNPIESTFATVRLRHNKTKGNGTREACLVMVFKLVQAAERTWRKLDGTELLVEVLKGTKFKDGICEAA